MVDIFYFLLELAGLTILGYFIVEIVFTYIPSFLKFCVFFSKKYKSTVLSILIGINVIIVYCSIFMTNFYKQGKKYILIMMIVDGILLSVYFFKKERSKR